MASTFVPARLHPPPKKRLITRKTTIRPYVFTKYNKEAKEEDFQENKKLLSNKDEQCISSLRTNSVSDTGRQNNAHTTSVDTVKSSDLNSTSNKSFTRKRNVSRCNLSLRSDKDKDNVENLLTVKTRSATSKVSQSFLTKKQEQCRSPLKTSNISDNEFQNNTSKRNKSSNKSFNNKKNTSKSNFNTLSGKIEDNVENSIKTRSTTAKLSQSLTVNPTYFKPNETASVLHFKSPKNLSRISCHTQGERSFQNSEPDQNSSAQLSQSSVSGSYSTDAILICRPANEKSSEITENNPVVNVVPSDSDSSHLYKNPSFYKKAGSSTKLKSSPSVPASKSILKAPVKNDDRMNQSIPPEMYLDTPTPTSKRKHSNPINLSYQFKKLKNTPNKSILRKVQKENSKMVSQPSHKCLTDQFLSSDNFKDAQQRELASDSLETTYAGNISNSVNEKSLNLSTWKDGDVQPVLESTRYSLIPQNKQTNKSYVNLPETPIIQRKYDDEKTGNLSKSVRWNSTIRYQIVSPTPDKRRHRNLGRRKLANKQKITSSLKKQKETQTKQKPSTSKSANNQEIAQKSPSPLHHQQPKASRSTSIGTKKMILRKSNRKKKMPELDADVFLDTILQKTSSFSRETAEKEEDEAAADVFCEVSSKIILKKIEEHFNVGTSKKSGKNDKSKAQKLQITVLKKHEDFKRLNEKIVDDKRELIQLKENKDRKKEINLFLFRLQDFHQRLIN